jgi:hypothetical protein
MAPWRRVVSLDDAALEVLRDAPFVDGNPFVIPGHKPGTHRVNLKASRAAICAAAGMEDLPLRDLRYAPSQIERV